MRREAVVVNLMGRPGSGVVRGRGRGLGCDCIE